MKGLKETQTITSFANTTILMPNYDNQFARGLSCQIVTTGVGSAGSVKLQASNDGSNWVDITGATGTISGASNIMIQVADAFYALLRLSMTSTNGTAVGGVVTYYAKG